MPDFLTTNGHTQVSVPLTIIPYRHQAVPTLTGSPFSDEAGTVLYGHYNMEYLLPGGDRLRLIANHHKKTVQLMLFTYQPELIKLLPGKRPSSLVADIISIVHRYRIRSASYSHPLTQEQEQKLKLANECIGSLNSLLKEERQLKSDDHEGHEALRKKVIACVGHCSDQNRILAIHPLISEGSLGDLLYEAHKTAQRHAFNRVFAVSRYDQMDFSKKLIGHGVKKKPSCLVWDSEIHIGHNSLDLDNALRVVCAYYKLSPTSSLNNVPANRLAKAAAFFNKLWLDGHDWINYLATGTKPEHKTEVQQRLDGLSITHISPYYSLQGFPQKGYSDLKTLVFLLTNSSADPIYVKNSRKDIKSISQLQHGHWAINASEQVILIKLENNLVQLRYFVHNGLFYPLPEGQDLYNLGQISKRHLYLPERVSLRVNAFFSHIPRFFYKFYNSLQRFIIHDLHDDFFRHVHHTHDQNRTTHDLKEQRKQQTDMRNSLIQVLENKGLLMNGQTLEEFIQEHISNSPYVIARPNHPPSPPAYDNPFHRALEVIRHLAGMFIETNERNPLIGSLALAAYMYGGSAILAPDMLKSILSKLHLHGLISGIEPTQKLAHWMSHGTVSETLSASMTYWQATVAGGNLDKFFLEAVNILKEDPAEVAIIIALALNLGYSLTKIIPALGKEMGDFPYMNYATLGAKGGAALYDTIMHPGNDWLLGTCKWLCKSFVTLGKLCIAPFFEGYYYGFYDGFLKGWQKSAVLLKNQTKQTLAASVDFILALITIPLLEVSALLIHIPFRGITNLITKTLGIFGAINAIGELLFDFATRPIAHNVLINFRFSPLYGFTWPFGHFSENQLINTSSNFIRALCLLPMQLIKNLLILPVIDLTSLSVRLGITVVDPISRLITYTLGSILCIVGRPWDNSFGLLFTACAKKVNVLSNWIDNKAGAVKQTLLSFIESQRGHLYHWVFANEDLQSHSILDDTEYYSKEPRRYELIPHSNSHCLLRTLLDNSSEPPLLDKNPPYTTSLFSGQHTTKKQNANFQGEAIHCSI